MKRSVPKEAMMRSQHVIYIKNEQDKYCLLFAQKRLLKAAVNAALDSEGYEGRAEVSIVICDDEHIHELNKEFRNVDRPTDVLSFPTDDDDEDIHSYAVPIGDIVISLERAYVQAEEYGHSIDRELAFLCVHSVLHLLGYDHEQSEAAEKEMFSRQELILSAMGLER